MRARRAGPLAAGALVGERHGAVAAIQSTSVHVLLDEGPLISVLADASPLHAWAIVLPVVPAAFRLLNENDAVLHRDGVLTMGPIRIEMEDAEVPDLRLDRRPRELKPERVAALARLLPERVGAPGAFDGEIDSALERFRQGGESAALAAVLGVGEGLTPSGDDVLTGVLAGLDAAHRIGPEPGIQRDRLVAVLSSCPARTTRLSAQLLAAAATGRYPEPVLDVLEAIAPREILRGQLEHTVRDLVSVGHTTGSDVLRGIVAALERVTGAPTGA